MKIFKARASYSGKLMGVKGLGKTGLSYVEEWLKEQLYGRRKEFTNKYTEKGLIMEDDAIDLVGDFLKIELFKNTEYFENECLTGTPDVVLNDLVIDVKCSYDCFTFPLCDETVPNPDYYWQAQAYMDLTKRKHYKLCYCLMDTPAHIIRKEANKYCWDNGFGDINDNPEILAEYVKKMSYSDLPLYLRLKIFDIEYNKADVTKLYTRVDEAREYLKTLGY